MSRPVEIFEQHSPEPRNPFGDLEVDGRQAATHLLAESTIDPRMGVNLFPVFGATAGKDIGDRLGGLDGR